MSMSDRERSRIRSQKIQEGIAARRAAGGRIGRPPQCPEETKNLVFSMILEGVSYRAICARLNANGIATAGGGKCWQPSYINRLLNTDHGSEAFAEAQKRFNDARKPLD